jgi:glutamyl-tRNA(Gln) amidotransferase subunit D
LSREESSGYAGLSYELLNAVNAKVGDHIRLELKRPEGQETVEGLLMPRYRTRNEEDYIVVKLPSGYNVGVRIDSETKITVLGKGQAPQFIRPPPPSQKPNLPRVSIVSTGGTIASKVDYRTGAVKPALDAEDLYSVVPELADVADIQARVLYSLFSENIGPQHWPKIAEYVADQARKGAEGVVIAHGTDTLGYTAAALSFAFTVLPIPVVLVGSQRSSDRPSSDAASNLVAATAVAGQAPFAEVVVAMHDWISDEKVVVHRGTKVRKCHTSRRDAFRSVNAKPIAHYDLIHRTLELDGGSYSPRRKGEAPVLQPQFDPNVALIKYHPGISAGIIDWAVATGYKGLVLEGTGLGHVGDIFFSSIERAVQNGVVVGMCSQCIWGRVHMNVYSTGRDLLRMGVLPLGDMLSETALVKMMWAFGHEKDPESVKKIMLTNVANEYSNRRELEELIQ